MVVWGSLSANVKVWWKSGGRLFGICEHLRRAVALGAAQIRRRGSEKMASAGGCDFNGVHEYANVNGRY
jgi:hypothetical protein